MEKIQPLEGRKWGRFIWPKWGRENFWTAEESFGLFLPHFFLVSSPYLDPLPLTVASVRVNLDITLFYK